MSVRERQEIQEVLRRRVIILGGIGVTAFWLVMIALLLRREVFTPYLHPAQTSQSFPTEPSDIWMGLLLNDKAQTPIGYINIRTQPGERDSQAGVNVRMMGRLKLNLGTYQGELLVSGDAWASKPKGLQEFSVQMRSGAHSTAISATLVGGRVKAVIDSGGEKWQFEQPLGNSMMLTSAPGFTSFSALGINVGDEVLVDAFDPLSMSAGKARVACIGEETISAMGKSERTKVFSTELSGMKSKAWVDSAGNVLRAETPIGFVLQRMTESDAMKMSLKDDSGQGLLQMAAVPAAGKTPVRGAKMMKIALSGVGGITVNADDAYTLGSDGRMTIRPLAANGPPVTISDVDRNASLANDSFLQIDHPKIVSKAKEIIGSENDPWKKAMLIYEWVHSSVRKNIVPSLPTSLDVLNTMEGDCNEHTVLYTALARSVGIPTRMNIGLVWSEDFHGFYYHAWPEVYVGRWVWMDPTLGQPVADATHLELIKGDLMSWWRIAPFMGNIKIRVLEVE